MVVVVVVAAAAAAAAAAVVDLASVGAFTHCDLVQVLGATLWVCGLELAFGGLSSLRSVAKSCRSTCRSGLDGTLCVSARHDGPNLKTLICWFPRPV